jgi:hypothetical protein
MGHWSIVGGVPPLPPKPKAQPVVPQALVLAALSVSGCPSVHRQVRIGQPPPIEVEQECLPTELRIIDARGNPLAGVEVRLADGETLVSDDSGTVARADGSPIEGSIEHPGFEPTTVSVGCERSDLVLQAASDLERTPPRIGRPPLDPPPINN